MCTEKYEKGFKDGVFATLEKIAASVTQKDPEICLLYAMEWTDNGCCLNCAECVKAHRDEIIVKQNEHETIKNDAQEYEKFISADTLIIMYDLLKELDWYFHNVKTYYIPYHYKDCLFTAVKYAADGNFIEARNLTKSCIETRREFGAF